MGQNYSGTARIVAGVIALSALGALALQTTLNLDRDGTPLVAAGLLLRFFTIWSNLAAGIVLGLVALGRRVPPAILHALATALAIVGAVYWALLSGDHHPVGLDRVTNQFHHTLVPAATILWWFAWAAQPRAGWSALPAVMVAPVAYAVFALGYGAYSGFYAYFFLDASALGWGQLAVNIVGLALFFLLVGAILIAIKRRLSARA